nr:MAG TPA: hypothetical protein [Caudoviricetes sp.]
MSKSKKTVKTDTKVEKTTSKAIEKKAVKKAPEKAKVVNPAKGTPRAKKPIAKPTAKSPAVKKAAEAAIPSKVNPSSSSEATNEITTNTVDTQPVESNTMPSVRELDKEAKVIEEQPIVETMYLAHCLFKRDSFIISEVIGIYTTTELATQAIQAREAFHIEQGHGVIHSVMSPILVDNIEKEKITAVVYEENLNDERSVEDKEDEAIAEERKEEPTVTANEMEEHVENLAKEETKVTEEDIKKWLVENNYRLTVLNKQPLDVYVVAGSYFTANEEFVSTIYGVSRDESSAKAILRERAGELERKLATRIKLQVHKANINPYASDAELYNASIEVSRLGSEWFSFGGWIENFFKKLFKKNK